jgi:hypothetical protein
MGHISGGISGGISDGISGGIRSIGQLKGVMLCGLWWVGLCGAGTWSGATCWHECRIHASCAVVLCMICCFPVHTQ